MGIRASALLDGAALSAKVLSLVGDEELSRPYTFDATLSLDTGSLELDALIGRRVAIELFEGSSPLALDAQAQRFAGVVSKVRVLAEVDGSTLLGVTLVPAWARLADGRHSRIFTNEALPAILEAVLRDEGITSFRLELGGEYARREHVCQYRESSLAFLSRWLEREGIGYRFEHHAEGEELVFFDDNTALESAPPLRFVPLASGDVGASGAFRVGRKVGAPPAAIELFDRDPLRPALDVRGVALTGAEGLGARLVRWGDNLRDPAEAAREAKLMAEVAASQREHFALEARTFHLRAGVAFALSEHPLPSFDAELYATRVRHVALLAAADDHLRTLAGLPAGDGYRVEVVARRADVAFRPARVTPWPRIGGVVEAFVDGAGGGDYAQLDVHGRYKLQFRFDESDLVDGTRSTYVRRLQPHGGGVEGFHFPLRKGTEVEVMFLGGDPDQPVIVGAAANLETPSKVSAQNHTANVIHTGGDNRIELEDSAGGQFVRITCPTATTKLHLGAGPFAIEGRTDGKGNVVTGSHILVEVGAKKREDVTGGLTETYGATHTLTVTGPVITTHKTSVDSTVVGPVSLHATGPQSESVASLVREELLSTFSHTTTGGTKLDYAAGLELHVGSGLTEIFDASYDRTVSGPMRYEVTGEVSEELGPTHRSVNGTYDLTVDGTYTLRAASLKGDASGWNNSDALLDGLVDLYDKTHGIDLDLYGLSASATGISMAAYKQKSSTTGVSATLAHTSVSVAGLSLSMAPDKRFKALGCTPSFGAIEIEVHALILKI